MSLTLADGLLFLLFFLTIAHLVTLKVCSLKLDHRTAPLFISGWTLLGVLAVSPFYGHLLNEGWAKMMAEPHLLVLTIFKGAMLYFLFVISQKLMAVSLSSRHYVSPLSVGLVAIVNSFFGEALELQEWFAALGLCALAAAFFFKGHLADLDRQSRFHYAQLVGIAVLLAALDQILTKNSNWYTLLLISNLTLFTVSIAAHGRDVKLMRDAFLHKSAAYAGLFYAATELVKFYQQVTINPVTVVMTVQAMTKPVILVLGALIWKERTVKEQLVWGILAFLVILPLFVDESVFKGWFK